MTEHSGADSTGDRRTDRRGALRAGLATAGVWLLPASALMVWAARSEADCTGECGFTLVGALMTVWLSLAAVIPIAVTIGHAAMGGIPEQQRPSRWRLAACGLVATVGAAVIGPPVLGAVGGITWSAAAAIAAMAATIVVAFSLIGGVTPADDAHRNA